MKFLNLRTSLVCWKRGTKTSPETELEKTITLLKERLDKNKANSKPEKNNNLEEYKNLIMQLDALNALKAVRNQLSELNGKSVNLIKDNTRLENEKSTNETKVNT